MLHLESLQKCWVKKRSNPYLLIYSTSTYSVLVHQPFFFFAQGIFKLWNQLRPTAKRAHSRQTRCLARRRSSVDRPGCPWQRGQWAPRRTSGRRRSPRRARRRWRGCQRTTGWASPTTAMGCRPGSREPGKGLRTDSGTATPRTLRRQLTGATAARRECWRLPAPSAGTAGLLGVYGTTFNMSLRLYCTSCYLKRKTQVWLCTDDM